MLLALAGGASAWGTSVNIAAVDDQGTNACGSEVVCSDEMGGVYAPDIVTAGMTGTMTRVEPGTVNTATLASYDTLFLFNCNPGVFSAAQQADIVAFIKGGGKLVIWDSEDQYDQCGGTGCWDYSWLPTPFSESVPGAQGAAGSLVIVEENQLSTNAAGPYFIDAPFLSTQTDAVGDANVFTKFVSAQWCSDMEATNVLEITGPVHVYTRPLPSTVDKGIIIFSGLDWDYNGAVLHKMLAQEFNANTLPCNFKPTEYFVVTKTADKTQYNIGDDIVFDLSVQNPGSLTSEDTEAVDYPPAEVTCSVTTADIGDLLPGDIESAKLTCKAVTAGCGLTNSVIVTGNVQGVPVLTGSATSAPFNIGYCGPVNAPEFPTLALPIGMIIGIVFIVYSVKRKD